MEKRAKLNPFCVSTLILVVCQALTFYVAAWVKDFIEESQITFPEVSLGTALSFFFAWWFY